MRAHLIRLRVGRAQAAELRKRLEQHGIRAFRRPGVAEALWPESDDRMTAWFQALLEESPRDAVSVIDERTVEVGEELFRAASPPEMAS